MFTVHKKMDTRFSIEELFPHQETIPLTINITSIKDQRKKSNIQRQVRQYGDIPELDQKLVERRLKFDVLL